MKFCKSCGTQLDDAQQFCPNCGANQAAAPQQPQYAPPQQPQYAPPQQPQYAPPQQPQYAPPQQPQYAPPQPNYGAPQGYYAPQGYHPERANWPVKSKVTAGILALLLGGIGVHKFYLGKAGAGVLYLLFCWSGIPGILALIDGISILCSNDEAFMTKYQCRIN